LQRQQAGIFVPFPRAADDHQRVNAEALARAGSGSVVEESKLEGVWLAETLAALLEDVSRLARMGDRGSGLAHPTRRGTLRRWRRGWGESRIWPRISADFHGYFF